MPRFVVQHHLATADHYDLRLEIDGVLVSWAVPRGPSLDPRVRRMAKRVDDHDLAYAGYEGVLSPRHPTRGRRGGGVVQVWDHGTWRYLRADGRADDAAEALERGHLTFELDGTKLRGAFSLIETGAPMWLLLKKRDAFADDTGDVLRTRPASAVTGRTMSEIEEAG